MDSAQGGPLIYLLDTDVLSQTSKETGHPAVMRWLQRHSLEDLAISAISLHEIQFGLEMMDEGQKKQNVAAWARALPLRFQGRVLSIDTPIALSSGTMLAKAKRTGHVAQVADCLIAATAHAHNLQLATLNRKDFARLGVELVDF